MDNYNGKILPDTIIERNGDIPTVDLDGEIGMMSVAKGRYFCLDPVGSHIWRLLDQPKSLNDIISSLLNEYDVDKRTCEKQVLDFVIELFDNGLILIK